ncbi:hypothetical protein [Paraburkholderia caribensis]|uniref:hypothetical protein n=1 Tax=Paraburkholderia caribensis TaxID=75105 RepID=UPI0020917670|nr:hypothetical protein [Paraburkholderia caribensis]MCO4880265.1 hypothetical protein [Paraburkholderia caribensis]
MAQPATDWLNSDAVKLAIPALATLLGSGLTLLFTHLAKRSADASNFKLEALRHDREQDKALTARKSEVAKEIISAIGATETALAKYSAIYRGGVNFYNPVVTDEIRPKLENALNEIGSAIEGCLASRPLAEILGNKDLRSSYEIYLRNIISFNRLIQLPLTHSDHTPDKIEFWHGQIETGRLALLAFLRPIYLGEVNS